MVKAIVLYKGSCLNLTREDLYNSTLCNLISFSQSTGKNVFRSFQTFDIEFSREVNVLTTQERKVRRYFEYVWIVGNSMELLLEHLL